VHFGGDSPELIIMTVDNTCVTFNFVPFIRGENTDGIPDLKYFGSTIPMVRTKSVRFDINLEHHLMSSLKKMK